MSNIVYADVAEDCAGPEWLALVEPYVCRILSELSRDGWDVSILFCTNAFIQGLNYSYRKKNEPTDILSFEQGVEYTDETGITWFSAGDIIISLDMLYKNCEEFGVSPDEELKRLLIHGILHLAGNDHSDNSPDQPMLVLQESLLKKISSETIIKEKN